uniref:Uncharacterized protein n=1 Tax=Physcomitrium patens TaxID=3218 RepID=A0A2K1IVI6_PHYPA|nr:hypothetical protein PHYPA_025238 [Physcomitrium patens]
MMPVAGDGDAGAMIELMPISDPPALPQSPVSLLILLLLLLLSETLSEASVITPSSRRAYRCCTGFVAWPSCVCASLLDPMPIAFEAAVYVFSVMLGSSIWFISGHYHSEPMRLSGMNMSCGTVEPRRCCK